MAKVFRSRSWTPGRSRRGGVTSASTTPVGSRRRCFPQFTRPALGRLGRRPTHLADCFPRGISQLGGDRVGTGSRTQLIDSEGPDLDK